MYIYERMTTDVVSVPYDAKVADVFAKMKERRHSSLPVTDEKGRVMGLVTKSAIMDTFNISSDQMPDYASSHILKTTMVREVMSHGVLRINKNKLIEEAALYMKENRVNYLPVINDTEELVGVLTYSDVISAFVTISGIRENGTRIVINGDVRAESMSEILSCIASCGEEILFASSHVSKGGEKSIVVKTKGKKSEEAIFKLESKGFKIAQAKTEKG